MRRLSQLLVGVDVRRMTRADLVVTGISHFANKVKPGGIYVASVLPWMDGYRGIKLAVERGAAAIIVEQELTTDDALGCRTILVGNANRAYATMSANFFGHAYAELSLFAVTGTKGKTATCHVLESLLRNAGYKTGLISTITQKINDQEIPSTCTTPDPFELHRLFREMVSAGVTHVVLEASSIGIAEERLTHLTFDGLIFTNLGHDHLTYHGGLENYWHAKRRLFTDYVSAGGKRTVCAINVDDQFGELLASVARGEVVTYGAQGEISGEALYLDRDGISGDICGVPINSSMLGAHNVYNILGAVALGLKIGIPAEAIAAGISSLPALPGRLERAAAESGIDIFVDYAHTPESVFTVLMSLKAIFAEQELITVLGCGGGTDRAKRPVMAKIAFENSDFCIFTSDNPRHEDPLSIIEDMCAGIEPAGDESSEQRRLEILVDRRQAIHRGVEIARQGGVLVILGKGHETYQVIGDALNSFDDREVAAEALKVQRIA
jgi:UDP-N-acetylmuramoyl-L-alanyl-D-glutamate--2,6-diaminopimelate ligase